MTAGAGGPRRLPEPDELAARAEHVDPLAAPETCTDLVRELGRVAAWVLAPELLDAVARDDDASAEVRALARRPNLGPGTPGGALPLVALRDDRLRCVLAPAFALPLRWSRGPDGPGLPPAARQLATEVREAVGGAGWGLALDPDLLGPVDLRAWPLELDSAWAALAAALLVARDGGRTDRRVLATACWRPGAGVTGVEPATLPAKVDAAVALGARWLAVAPADEEHARALAAGRVGVLGLVADPDPQKALAPLLAELEVPPDPAAPLPERLAFHRRLGGRDAARALDYYGARLLDDLVASCAGAWRGPPVERLVTVASTNPESSLFALEALRPAHVLLLYTARSAAQRAWIEAWLGARPWRTVVEPVCVGPESRAERFDLATAERDVHAAVRAFAARAPGALAVDVTPGWKWMNTAATLAAPAARIVYVEQIWQDRARLPGDEALRQLQRP